MAPFILQLKKFLGSIQSYEDVLFSGPKLPICHEQIFFSKKHYFHLPIIPFHWANFLKNSSSGSRECAIIGSKMAHFPKWDFFFPQKTCWWALFLSFMPIYMPKIKVIQDLLAKYWWLKNTEVSLAERHFFGYNLKTRFFPSMQFSQNVDEP